MPDIGDFELTSTSDFKAQVVSFTELVTCADPTTFTDPQVVEVVDRLRGVLENKRLDGMVVTGEFDAVVEPTAADVANHVTPTINGGQR